MSVSSCFTRGPASEERGRGSPPVRGTARLTGPVDDHADDLYEAGCDDATLGEIDGVSYADFDREADSLDEAIIDAITVIEPVPSLHVARVEPDDLVTAGGIAQRLGRTRESIRLLSSCAPRAEPP